MDKMPDRDLIRRYSDELMRMYRSAKPSAVYTQTEPFTSAPVSPREPVNPPYSRPADPPTAPARRPLPQEPVDGDFGQMIVRATTLRGTSPVPRAQVTVFTGSLDDRNVYESMLTDSSGRSKAFRLPTPPRRLSATPDAVGDPYALYNISVLADGFIEHINMNVPVFPGITSLQGAELVLLPASGVSEPRVFDGFVPYDL